MAIKSFTVTRGSAQDVNPSSSAAFKAYGIQLVAPSIDDNDTITVAIDGSSGTKIYDAVSLLGFKDNFIPLPPPQSPGEAPNGVQCATKLSVTFTGSGSMKINLHYNVQA